MILWAMYMSSNMDQTIVINFIILSLGNNLGVFLKVFLITKVLLTNLKIEKLKVLLPWVDYIPLRKLASGSPDAVLVNILVMLEKHELLWIATAVY